MLDDHASPPASRAASWTASQAASWAASWAAQAANFAQTAQAWQLTDSLVSPTRRRRWTDRQFVVRTGLVVSHCLVALVAGVLVIPASVVAAVAGTPQVMAEQEQDEQAGGDEERRPPLTAEQERFFETKIRPALVTHCYSCHSNQSGRIEGDLAVDSAAALRLGGQSGPAIDLEDFSAGLFWQAINYEGGLEMPPQGQLPAHVIADFRTWLEDGAPDPRVSQVVRGAYVVTPEAIEAGRQFWSLQPLPAASAALVPAATGQAEAAAPNATKPLSPLPVAAIDRFVELKRREQGLPTPPSADSHTIFRRLCFDLIGLPPTAEQVAWFQVLWAEDPDKAVATAVDFMLESPKFGERWGRHWLDIVRYAESTGREVNMPYTEAWRYRDYVIDAFNQDKPYDRFLKEQLVGDLLPASNKTQKQQQLIATGFLALGPKTLNERSERQFAADLIDEQIDVTTRGILGISVACARCHDHKFEAITQKDYYALAGIFGNMVTHFGGIRTQRTRHTTELLELPVADPTPALPTLPAAQVKALQERINELQTEIRELRRETLQARRPNANRNRNRNRNDSSMEDNNSNRGGNSMAMEAQQRQQTIQRLTTQVGTLQGIVDSYNADGTPRSLYMGVKAKSRPTDARLLERGEVTQPGPTVPRGFVQLLDKNPPRIRRDSTGRMEFANWVTSPRNPLTARVMANRVWQHLIGTGIVSTPEDFGVTGNRPTHPELLDYLAVRLIENDWSIKALIKEIATSAVYRAGWQVDAVASERDPDNQYLWRSQPQRLSAEVLRDSLLWVGGSLELERPHASLVAQAGPTEVGRGQQLAQLMRLQAVASANRRGSDGADSDSMMSESMMSESKMQESMGAATAETRDARPRAGGRNERAVDPSNLATVMINETSVNRSFRYRSIYLPSVRDLLPRSMDLFDAAEPSMVIGVREQSNTAPQALYMLNNELVRQQALSLAERTLELTGSQSQAIDYVFQTAYSRPPTAEEAQQAADLLTTLTTDFVAEANAKAQERAAQQRQARQREQRQREARQRQQESRRRGNDSRNGGGNNPRGTRGERGQGTENRADGPPLEDDPRTAAAGVVVSNPYADDVSPEIQRRVMLVFCHAILASAEFRYRN